MWCALFKNKHCHLTNPLDPFGSLYALQVQEGWIHLSIEASELAELKLHEKRCRAAQNRVFKVAAKVIRTYFARETTQHHITSGHKKISHRYRAE